MSSINTYRGIYVRLTEDADFNCLSEEARLTWFYLKLSPECGPTGLFAFNAATFAARTFGVEESTGLQSTEDMSRFNAALDELQAAGYIEREKNYIRLVNSMRYDPSFNPETNINHRKSLRDQLIPQKNLRLTAALLEENNIEVPKGWGTDTHSDRMPMVCLWPPDGMPMAIEGASNGMPITETEPEPETDPERESETISAGADFSGSGRTLTPETLNEDQHQQYAEVENWDEEDWEDDEEEPEESSAELVARGRAEDARKRAALANTSVEETRS